MIDDVLAGKMGIQDTMTLKQAQIYLGVSRTTIRRWRQMGKLGGYQVNGRPVVRVDDVQRIKREQLDAATQPEPIDKKWCRWCEKQGCVICAMPITARLRNTRSVMGEGS